MGPTWPLVDSVHKKPQCQVFMSDINVCTSQMACLQLNWPTGYNRAPLWMFSKPETIFREATSMNAGVLIMAECSFMQSSQEFIKSIIHGVRRTHKFNLAAGWVGYRWGH